MSQRPLEASVIVIGDEILGGFVQDTNSGWLARRLEHHGVELSRIVTIPDDLTAIDEALQTELSRSRPRIVFTSGGIGSTPDDLTYQGVAASLDRDLVVDPVLAHRIDGAVTWTQEHGLEVDDRFVDHMMQMARVPAGSERLRDTGSFAPGIRVDVDGGVDDPVGATVVVLPGVPSQFHRIVTEAVEPDLLAGRGVETTSVEITHGYPESVLNHCFDELAERWPDVRIGSYPGAPMVVRLRGPRDDVERAHRHVEDYLADLDEGPGAGVREAWAQRFSPAERPEDPS